MPKTVIVPMTCAHCGKGMVVECEHTPGFSIMQHYAIDCPHCGKLNHQQPLPGDIVDIRRSEDAEESE